MIERSSHVISYDTRPKLAVVCDDANSLRTIIRAQSLPFPVHMSVIATDDPAFRMGVRELALRYKDDMASGEPGLHLSWLTGNFPKRTGNLFGPHGLTHQALHTIEKARNKSKCLGRVIAKEYGTILYRFTPDIQAEMVRQIQIIGELFGNVPYITYHHGIHHFPFLYELYHRQADALGIPHRGAAKYNRLPFEGGRLIFHDRLNHKGVTPDEFNASLLGILHRGLDTELCVHLGNTWYGRAQTLAFTDERVRKTLLGFHIMMPHEILREKMPQKYTR